MTTISNNSSNIHLDFLSSTFTDKHIMYLLHMAHNSLIKMIAADTDRRIHNNTAKAQHSDISSSTANINNHVATRYGNINTGAKSRSQRFLNQIGFGSTALGSSLHNSTLFYRSNADRHTSHNTRFEKQALARNLLNNVSQQLLRYGIIRNNAFLQRTDSNDTSGSTSQHFSCIIAHSQHLVAHLVNSHNRRLLQDNALALDKNKNVSGTQINTDIHTLKH